LLKFAILGKIDSVTLNSKFRVIKEGNCMQTIKQEALDAISRLPDSVNLDDIMYRLFVLDKIKRGQEAVQKGETITTHDLKTEIESW
jgi:hypothetical protein